MSKQRDDYIKRIREVLVEKDSIVMAEDGYYVYWPNSIDGFNSAVDLRIIADILDEKNKPWHDQVIKDLTNAANDPG